ncbi:MAG: DUF177 domain-containing protein [Chloroflexaceae bacterium]|nr:DUF177 domain-containing protein [Chloroflexaceae bacterium]NJL32616.1 DUF177 domain-containing protein [Chloroflexaceae bacterium]NJO04733.1 DUF177 domain-containing protein [Chloroflexaceae bacterium]
MTILKFNVAQLLREDIGSKRHYTFNEDVLPLDETLRLRAIAGVADFIRTASGIFAHVKAQGQVRLVCVRSLDEFDYPITVQFAEEMHSVVDVFTGAQIRQKPIEEDPFYLDENHMADVGELIREYTLLEIPMNPVSEAYRDQPVSYTVESDDLPDEGDDEGIDERLRVLREWANRQNDNEKTRSD